MTADAADAAADAATAQANRSRIKLMLIPFIALLLPVLLLLIFKAQQSLAFSEVTNISDSSGGSSSSSSSSSSCIRACQNGGTCYGGACSCRIGFSGRYCQFGSSCPRGCSGHGRCLGSGACKCDADFTGADCSKSITAKCYTQNVKGKCSKPLTQFLIPREVCCNSFGKAWGSGCDACAVSQCGAGRIAAADAAAGCVDIKMCSIRGICGDGSCEQIGNHDFRCRCTGGKIFNKNLRICEPAPDYCQRNRGACGIGGSCVSDGAGSFSCRCRHGFLLRNDAKFCFANPCSISSRCQHGKCSPIGEYGDYRCSSCRPGFALSSDQRNCIAVTYCSLNPTACTNGTCIPIDDLYTCSCDAGFHPAPSGLECRKNLPTTVSTSTSTGCSCGKHGRCKPPAASNGAASKCECDSGWRPNSAGDLCELAPMADAPEWQQQQQQQGSIVCAGQCSNGLCRPFADEFICICFAGWRLTADAKACLRSAESTADASPSGSNPCQSSKKCENGRCSNLGGGSYLCACNEGYRASSDMQRCERQRFCEENRDSCRHGRCVDLPGGAHRCECNEGFQLSLDATTCIAHRQQQQGGSSYCRHFPYACGRGQCRDLSGSHNFTCSCPEGYRLSADRRHCSLASMRESGACARRPLACRGAGHCVNAGRGFSCFCYPGFRHRAADRRSCWPFDFVAESQSITIHGISSIASAPAKPPEFAFTIDGDVEVVDSVESENYAQLQVQGDAPAAAAGACSKIGHTACQHGVCSDLPLGDYRCLCDFGFTEAKDGRSCVDHNECEAAGNDLCVMGECVNTIGSYTCRCKPGFRLDAAAGVCVDRNECTEYANLCPNGRCVNQFGKFECSCNPGFQLEPYSRRSCVKFESSISIDGSIEVVDNQCPDCKFGCAVESKKCKCSYGELAVGGILCLPENSRNIKLSASEGKLEAAMPLSASSGSIEAASRSIRKIQCRIRGLANQSILMACSFVIGR